MVTPKTGSVKKVQFYAAVAILACSFQAGAAELAIPMAEVQQELARKTEQAFARKLQECQGDMRSKKQEQDSPRYPVRIADKKPVRGGLPTPVVGVQLVAR